MKNSFYLMLISFLLLSAPAVLGQTTYYLKNNGDYAISKETANFIRIVEARAGDLGLHPTNEFYLSGAKRSTGQSFRKDPPLYQGTFISYFEDGTTKQLIQYDRGQMVDTAVLYYPNGKVYQLLRRPKFGDSSQTYIETLNDSSGTASVQAGNGRAMIYDADFRYITAQGNIKDGRYEGEWKGELRDADLLRYTEQYQQGKLLSGESTDEQGNKYQYTESEVKPTFSGGMRNFYIYVIRNIRYPRQLAMARTQGIAQISFVVRRTGEIADAHAINDVHPALATEAIRILKGAKGWIPGQRKGKSVDMALVMPFTFNTNF